MYSEVFFGIEIIFDYSNLGGLYISKYNVALFRKKSKSSKVVGFEYSTLEINVIYLQWTKQTENKSGCRVLFLLARTNCLEKVFLDG